MNDGFYWTELYGDVGGLTFNNEGLCMARVPGAVGACVQISYTPAQTNVVSVGWTRIWDMFYTHPPVCLADGAKKVTFVARGVTGGEVISVSAIGQGDLQLTLTNEWKSYAIAIPAQHHTHESGLEKPLTVQISSTATFAIDNVQYIK